MEVIRIKSQPIFGLPNTKKESLVPGKLCKPALTYTIPKCSASGSLTTKTPALTYAYSTSVA